MKKKVSIDVFTAVNLVQALSYAQKGSFELYEMLDKIIGNNINKLDAT
jgi:hypothetical protein